VIYRVKNQNETAKVAVVTGSSSGIGYATSLQLARSGYLTFATMRNPAKGADLVKAAENENLPVRVEQLDVTDIDSINDFMARINSAGRIDVLVNNAGYGLFGALEDLSIEEIKAQYETNLFGLIMVTQAVLPLMRKQRSGIIVNVSSLVGRIGLPSSAAYVSTKFALEGLTEAIAYELEPFGIKVVLIEPGVIKTNFMGGLVVPKKASDPSSPYSQLTQKMNTTIGSMMKNGATLPEQVAKAILQAVTVENPELRYVVGDDAVALMEMRRKTPSDAEFIQLMKQNLLK
jgi:NAD(P)-dependent dehydrogenase (short-subunit alcohol dehydrogenase family)